MISADGQAAQQRLDSVPAGDSDVRAADAIRLVVFTGDLSYSVRAGIVEIDRAVDSPSWLIVLQKPRRVLFAQLKGQWRNFRINGWRWIPYLFRNVFARIVSSRRVASPLRGPGSECTTQALLGQTNIRLEEVESLNSDSTLNIVLAYQPDIGLSLAAPILRRALFSLPKHGTLNLHKGSVPHYRGMPPAFWELWNGEREVGCTVHQVDDKLDAGAVVSSAMLTCQRYSDVIGLQLRLDVLGIQLMRNAVIDTVLGRSRPTPQPCGGRTFRKPTLRQISSLQHRISSKLPRARAGAGHAMKEAIRTVAISGWKCGGANLLRPRIVVLLYHRVSDDARDNLTIGISHFDRQMAFLRRRCLMLSLDEVIAFEEGIPRSNCPLVCVTFDDGYLDNYEHAAPILRRHAIPAAFFVSTGLIGSDRPFAHDVRRKNARPPAMTWQQVQDLHRQGFAIGSHTVNHIDCAKETIERVRAELAKSRDDLRERIGMDKVYFAYPYGGRQNMTPERLQLIKEAGYTGCLSAYGGANVDRVDRFNVLRKAINWETSDRALHFACLGIS